VGRAGVAGAAGAGATAATGFGGAAAGASRTSPGPIVRRFTFSTTTVLVRPWEKLCLTTPDSTGRFSDSVFGGSFVSLIDV
jgi:hypothetical protein